MQNKHFTAGTHIKEKLVMTLLHQDKQASVPHFYFPCHPFSFAYIPDFESESVEYLLPSALPSLKSEKGPLFPVKQVRHER